MTERQASYNAGETEPIKPCPFCGHPKPYVFTADYTDYIVACHCSGQGPTSRNESEAILLWNAAANALEAVKAERDEAKKIAEFRKKALEAERNVLLKHATNLLSQRDEARACARKLWREKQAEKLVCPACGGDGYVIVDIIGYSNGRMQKCFFCNGTGKVTK